MSLKWKTATLFLLASLLIIPVSVEYILRLQSAKVLQQQVESHKQLLDQLAIMASEALSGHDENLDSRLIPIQQRFSQYAELPQYQGFYLYQNDNILAAYETGAVLPDNLQQYKAELIGASASDSMKLMPFGYKYIKPIITEQETFILMIVSPEKVRPDYLILSNNIWFIILLVIILLALTGYITSNRLAIKVDELIVGISKAGGGNYSQRISGSGNDEVAQLVTSYNRMLDNMLSGSQECKEQLLNYKSILDNAAEGIISINDRGVIQEYNQSAEVIFGYSAEEIIGKNITRLIPTKIAQEYGIDLEQNFIPEDDESSISREVIGVRNNEQNFPIELSVSESSINNAQVYTGIIRDISERKQSDMKQISLEMQLRKLQRQNSLESLSGGIAHDFNNILGPVLGYADMAIADAEEGTRLHRYLTSILKGAHRARELVARIMSFNRQTEHATEQIHITKAVEDSLELITSSLPAEHQIEVFFNTTDDLIAAESIQLTQVLVTMVTNASQAMKNTIGTLTIRLDNIVVDEELLARSGLLHAGEYVRLRVQDTGVGMDSTTQARVFEPFFSTRDQNEGSGLGLSVAYGIISSFGGEILVDSEPDKGTVFSIFLPVIEEHQSKLQVSSASRPVSKKGELILYIDDDAGIVELGKEMLENLGYEVATSVSSEEALRMFSNDPEDFDLIITDQSMPILTGTQLTRELRRIRPDIPVILVSGFCTSIMSRDLADSGIDHCIAKPLVINELGQAVLEALAGSRQS